MTNKRLSAWRRGYDSDWRKLRDEVVIERGCKCECCGKPVVLRKAEAIKGVIEVAHLDHIIPIEDAPELRLVRSNLRVLAESCHDRHTIQAQGVNSNAGHVNPYWMPKPTCEVIMVCGAPSSGKSTYCTKHMKSDNILIDMDACFQAVAGVYGYGADRAHISAALRMRNKQLANLAKKGMAGKTAYFIVGAPAENERKWWAEKLNAKIVFLDVPRRECIRRAKESGTFVNARLTAIERWFMKATLNTFKIPVKRISGACNEDGTPTDKDHPWNV